jgi:hypothetical protein
MEPEREEPMTSFATLAITACNELVARRLANPSDVSDAELIAARTVVWRAEDAAETEAERLACRAAGAAVSEALEAAYVAREAATAPVVAPVSRFSEVKATLTALFQEHKDVTARWLGTAADPVAFRACQQELSAIAARITPLMDELTALVP